MILKGSKISHNKGYSKIMIRASGQQSTNRMKKRVIPIKVLICKLNDQLESNERPIVENASQLENGRIKKIHRSLLNHVSVRFCKKVFITPAEI